MNIDEYDWKGLSPDLIEWLNSVTELLNNGKYSIRYGIPPTSATRGSTGDNIIAKDGSTWYLYIYTGTTDGWQKLQLAAI